MSGSCVVSEGEDMPYLGLILFALWIFCIVDVLTADQSQVRNLPKLAWVFIVLLLPEIGSLLWLILGRPRAERVNRLVPPTNGYPEYERLGRATGANSVSDEEFLRQCRARAEEQRRAYQEKLRRERGEADS